MRPTLIIAAFIAASPALAPRCPQGQFYRVRLDECLRLSSPLARPYLGAWSLQKNLAKVETIDNANVGEEVDTPEDRPSVALDPLAADPPPDEIDEAAWLMIPLLRAAEARWAATVSPARAETPPPDSWPFLSVYGLSNTNENFLPPPP
jgi:hypothetical protein